MRISRKVLLWLGVPLGLLALAGALVGLVVMSFREGPRRTISFPDGSRLTVLGTSLANQPFTTDKPWQATLRRWLPAGLQGWLPTAVTCPATLVSSGSYASNSLSVWFTYMDGSGTNSANSLVNGPARPWEFALPVARNGARFAAFQTGLDSVISAGRRVFELRVYSFPRRQGEFELQFFDRDWNPLGSLWVPNPVRGPFPEWTPERLPISRTNGPLVVRLEGLTETVKATPPFESRVTPTYSLANPEQDWRLANRLSLFAAWSDATGNQREPLDYRERAWKVSLEFTLMNRTNYSEYPGDERFVLSGLRVPEPGTLQVLTNEFERQGLGFKFYCLAGAGTLAVTNYGGMKMLASNSAAAGGALPRSATEASGSGFGASATSRGLGDGSSTLSVVEPPRLISIRAGSNFVNIVTSSRPFFLIGASETKYLGEAHFRVLGSAGQELRSSSSLHNRPMLGLSSTRSTTGLLSRTWLGAFDAGSATGGISIEATVNCPRTAEFVINPAEVQRLGKTNRLDNIKR